MYTSNNEISRRVYRALKTPSDDNPRTDPILAFHFDGKGDYIMMRCNKSAEVSIKGKSQDAGEVKFFAYSDFSAYSEHDVLFKLKDQVRLIELYRNGAEWKFRAVGQGYASGLRGIAQDFGVNV